MSTEPGLTQSIRTRITLLVVLSVLVGHLLTGGIGLFFADRVVHKGLYLEPGLAITGAIIALVVLATHFIAQWITAPLTAIANASRTFGRSPSEDTALAETGPAEVVQLARALNDSRRLVRGLMDGRTRMLVAISHDIRTPLTRLRLRAERVEESQRGGMLRDIDAINGMLTETLTYLREGGWQEPLQQTDLSSLLQTICSEFSDVGHNVSYTGPQRLPSACRPRALNRAVTNIVENATKNATSVSVKLDASTGGGAQIEVSDDGPGIPADLREKVFEPFYKGDDSRGGQGGFGLGLAIARDILREHGGSIELRDGVPKGLIVRISLPATSFNMT